MQLARTCSTKQTGFCQLVSQLRINQMGKCVSNKISCGQLKLTHPAAC